MTAQFQMRVGIDQAREKDNLAEIVDHRFGMGARKVISIADVADYSVGKYDAAVAQRRAIHGEHPGSAQKGYVGIRKCAHEWHPAQRSPRRGTLSTEIRMTKLEIRFNVQMTKFE
jgi:hypothetical protein